MDPNEALARARACRKRFDQSTTKEEAYTALFEEATAFEALDDWLSKGGFPPSDWRDR